MVFWEGYVSDEMMGTFGPIILYWLYGGMYQLLPPLNRYRLHTAKEEEQKNLVRLPTVVKGVLLQQLVQATVARLLFFRKMLRGLGFALPCILLIDQIHSLCASLVVLPAQRVKI